MQQPRLQPMNRPAASRPDPSSQLVRLVERMTERDTEAIRELYRLMSPLVHGLAYRITGTADDAEEVLVDTFHQAWDQAARYDPSRASVEGWLLNIARSRALDRLRTLRRRRRAERTLGDPEQGFPAEPPPSPERNAIRGEQQERLHRAVADLPADQRRALELAYFQGCSHSEIAERLGQPLGTVKTRLRLAMRKIRKVLAGVGEGESV